MKLKIAGKRVDVYDTLEELPYTLFVEYNIYALIDAGAGSHISDLDARLQRVWAKLATGDLQGGAAEINNFRQGFELVVQGVSPKMLSFAVLVKSIDGQPRTDKTEAGLRAIVAELSTEKTGVLHQLIADLKKKFRPKPTR